MNKWLKEVDSISKWMKEYLKESGCKGYVCGISGGADSALVSYLCCKAVGKENFIGMYLPCESSPNMEEDAIKLANNLGIELRVFNLIDAYNAIIEQLEIGGETVDQLTKANTKARLRMTMLFAIANQYNHLVAGTGNKSELEIGYVTVGGDQIASVESIGNYYKTEVYEMMKAIPEIPQSIIDKPASADLWQGQTDEQEIGMSYEELDNILKKCKIMHSYHNGYEKFGISEEKFNKVASMVEKAEYKNKVPPRYIRD
jgi:NAD+ synthase